VITGHAHGGRANPRGGRSLADPVFDPFWARVNEAGVRVCTHVGPTDYQKYGADFSEDPDAVLRDFDAFQWALYWGDRPAMDTVASLILHGFFARFPNVRVCLSSRARCGCRILLRKLDRDLSPRARGALRQARPPAERDLPLALRGGAVPRGERRARGRRGGDRADRVRLRLPARRGARFPGDYVAAQLGGFGEETRCSRSCATISRGFSGFSA
jgi:hypothetical protein